MELENLRSRGAAAGKSSLCSLYGPLAQLEFALLRAADAAMLSIFAVLVALALLTLSQWWRLHGPGRDASRMFRKRRTHVLTSSVVMALLCCQHLQQMQNLPAAALPGVALVLRSFRKALAGPRGTGLRIGFVHPDLGIGGAERLVVDAAVALRRKGHTVVMFTSHHDRSHCFEETRDGSLPVVTHGDFIPRSVLGAFYLPCTIIRCVVLSLWLVLGHAHFDVLFVDQLSAIVPVLRLTRSKILFYCHFPDKLLTTRESTLKRLYRVPLDKIEEYTTGMTDMIVANSKFTLGKFQDAFPSLRKCKVKVLYPAINFDRYPAVPPLDSWSGDRIEILSINRFERKKNIALAIRALAQMRSKYSESSIRHLFLSIAGGYDERVSENVEYLDELKALANDLGVQDQVCFYTSFTESQRTELLARCRVVVYTPENEHFGIVPIEAMFAGRPVVAANSGGPLETIVHESTGILAPPTPEAFASALHQLCGASATDAEALERAARLGKRARAHVRAAFSLDRFATTLDRIVREMADR